MKFLIPLMLAPTGVLADGFQRLASDDLLSMAETRALTEGSVVAFYDGGQSKYSVGGAYSYTYASGASAFGTFKIGEDGVICVVFRHGASRCDQYVRSHGRVVLLTEDGGRYPVKPQ